MSLENNRSHSPLNHRIVNTIPFLSLFLCCAIYSEITSVISEQLVSEWTTGHISCPGRTDGTVRAIYWLEYSNIPMYNCTLLDRWHIKKNPHRLERGGKYGPNSPHGTAEPNRQAKKQQQAMKINAERNAEEGEAGDAVLEAQSLKSASGVSEGCALLSYMPNPPGVRL